MNVIQPEMVHIPAGAVTMGTPPCPADFGGQHRWSGPREAFVPAFEIAREAVTRKEYQLFLEATGHDLPVDWNDPVIAGDRLPVCGVSWQDADAYCSWLARATGLPYRLPRANEWEKAARGGLTGARFPWGDGDPAGRCCFGGTLRDGPQPVGSFPANGYGLSDMVGNVWQWLAELYVDIASDPPLNTPTGKPAAVNRVLAGGSFMSPTADVLWVAYRHDDPPDLRHRCLGFRVARS